MYAMRLGVSTTIEGEVPTPPIGSVVMRDMLETWKNSAPVENFAHNKRLIVSDPVSYKPHERRIVWLVLLTASAKGCKL